MLALGNILIGVLTVMHVGILFIILFGWLFPQITYLYGLCLIATALSWILFNRCVLVDIEYALRGFFNLRQTNHNKSFTATIFSRLVGKTVVSDRLVFIIGVVVLSISIPYWIYSAFV